MKLPIQLYLYGSYVIIHKHDFLFPPKQPARKLTLGTQPAWRTPNPVRPADLGVFQHFLKRHDDMKLPRETTTGQCYKRLIA